MIDKETAIDFLNFIKTHTWRHEEITITGPRIIHYVALADIIFWLNSNTADTVSVQIEDADDE